MHASPHALESAIDGLLGAGRELGESIPEGVASWTWDCRGLGRGVRTTGFNEHHVVKVIKVVGVVDGGWLPGGSI